MHGCLYATSILKCSTRKSNRSNLSVSWSSEVSMFRENLHNDFPSKGNFYKSELRKNARPYEPFHPEDLRIRAAKAYHEAKRLRKEVKEYYKEFEPLSTEDCGNAASSEDSSGPSDPGDAEALAPISGSRGRRRHRR